MISEHIFKNYDIRGIVGEEIDEEISYNIGYYFTKTCLENTQRDNLFLIGYDNRNSSENLLKYLIKGVLDAKGFVKILGQVPIGQLYFADKYLSPSGSIMVTASHNPMSHNGFKFLLDGDSFYKNDIAKLKDKIQNKIIKINDYIINSCLDFQIPKIDNFHNYFHDQIEFSDLSQEYIKSISKNIEINENLKIIWDCRFGVRKNLVEKLTKNTNNQNIIITEENFNFSINTQKSSRKIMDPELISLVKEHNSDIAFSFDNDADRLYVITSSGRVLKGDEILCLFVKDIIANEGECVAVADIKTSESIIEYIRKLGAKVIISRTGYPYIRKALEIGKGVGSEVSGHFFFSDKYFGFDDGIYSALRIIDLVSRNNKSLDQLLDEIPIQNYIEEYRIHVPIHLKTKIIPIISDQLRELDYKFINMDGIRYSSGLDWFVIRESNTEQMITIRFGSDNFYGFSKIKNFLEDILIFFGIILNKVKETK